MSNQNKKDLQQKKYEIVLHLVVFFNFLDLVFTVLFIHHYGPGLEANIIARIIYENFNMTGLIVTKVISTYFFVIPMWIYGFSKRRCFISHIILWILVYITINHIIVYNILDGYKLLPHTMSIPEF